MGASSQALKKMMMKRTGKRLTICFRIERANPFPESHAWKVGLGFTPSVSSTDADNSIELDVIISGLTNRIQTYTFSNLAEFRLYLDYETDYSQADYDPDDSAADDSGDALLNLPALSHFWDFEDYCYDDTEILATVSFIGGAMENGDSSFLDVTPDKALGNSLLVSLKHGDETPGPSKTMPLESGLIGSIRLKRTSFM